MKNTKRSVTFKIVASYFLAGVLAVIAFWVIYRQINNYTQITEIKNKNNEKLFLVGETLTGLYEAESLTRNIVQTADVDKFKNYKAKIDTILKTIHKVSEISEDSLQTIKIDSLKYLIDSKNKNFEELIKLYKQRKEKGIYATAIDELKKANESFDDADYEKRFRTLDPQFRKSVVNIISLTKEDNAERLTNQTIDSLTTTVRQVLTELEERDKKYKLQISQKENKLLEKDQVITRQLRDLLATIEKNERNDYYQRLEASSQMLDKTSRIIVIIALASLLVAIVFLFLIIRDVSRSQTYRIALEEEKAYKESLLKTRETLITTVTHDLRSPLNSVIGYSDLLGKTALNTKQEHYLDHLKKSSDYILHLVNDLLDLSKLEAGKMIIEELPFTPKKVIESTVMSAIPINDPKQLAINIDTEESLTRQYLSDPFRIKQVLTNLINNAYKFTNSGSITVSSKILENGVSEEHLIIKIKDTGIGITEEQQQHIFEEFSQGDDNTEKQYGGFGLGLAITKKIILLLKGTITLESTPGEGSIFTVTIPVQRSHMLLVEEDSDNKNYKALKDKRVLLVDDDPTQLTLTCEVAELAGLQYDSASNAKTALKLALTKEYDLILTDIQMPQMDGFEFLTMLQTNEQTSQIPVIALSGRTDTTDTDYKKAGFADSLRKPYAPNTLLELIANTLQIDTRVLAYTSESETNNNEYSLHDLMAFAQGDSESLYAILDTFYNSTETNLKLLKKAVKTNDIEEIKSITHKILPMFRQIKATEVVELLERTEQPETYHLSNDDIKKLTNQSIQKIHALIDKLKVEG
ncbi:hybrid sensor histidine kinase/response regulator [Aquimarina sp. W85]|uniref:hybrid sensor histidine kinase/response regulator n=1 Tax=Aquimarina rhodophyticola TaxID=3342246 RepID=UPI003670D1E1